MASSSSSSAHNWTYDVYASFRVEEVSDNFLTHFRYRFKVGGISVLHEQDVKRSQSPALALKLAIRGSRIAIVVLSEKYASSSWYLDELVDILKCREELGQVVIPIYYRVDPSHVRNQTGRFGDLFEETCAGKTEEERQKWSQALTLVTEILGVRFNDGDDEADMIKKVVKDILEILNATPNIKIAKDIFPNRDFEEWGDVFRRVETNHDDRAPLLILEYEPPSSNEQIGKSWYSTGMAFLVVINLLVEIASATADQLSSITFKRISLGMSVLSVVLSLLDLIFKIRVHKACFQCNWPIPWFYYPPRRYNKILGNLTDTVLLFCVVAHLVVSGINYSFIHKRQDAPINVIVWPLVFAIAMVITKFMEKPAYSGDILPITKKY